MREELKQARDLRKRITEERKGKNPQGMRYPPDLWEAVVAWARPQVEGGRPIYKVAQEIGLTHGALGKRLGIKGPSRGGGSLAAPIPTEGEAESSSSPDRTGWSNGTIIEIPMADLGPRGFMHLTRVLGDAGISFTVRSGRR